VKALDELIAIYWANNTVVGKALTAAILFLGLCAVLAALAHRSRYRGRETHWLSEVRSRLELKLGTAPALRTDGDAKGGLRLVKVSDLDKDVPPRSLIGARLAAIATMKSASAKVSVATLQQMSILGESAKLSLALPGYVANVAMMLGLLGTFIGLSLMVQDIQVMVPAGLAKGPTVEWVTLVQGMERVIAAKKTVFSATIAGLVVSILVSWLNHLLAHAQATFYDRLERFTVEQLLPATVPSGEDETLVEKLYQQLVDSFEGLQKVSGENARAAEQIAATQKAFGEMVDDLRAMTEREASAPSPGFPEMSNVLGQLTKVNGSIVGLVEEMPRLVSSFGASQKATLEELSRLVRGLQQAVDRAASPPDRPVAHGRPLVTRVEPVERSNALELAAVVACFLLLVLLIHHW